MDVYQVRCSNRHVHVFLQTLNTGSMAWTTCTGIAYWYMVASWGGYSFVINIIPIHALVRCRCTSCIAAAIICRARHIDG